MKTEKKRSQIWLNKYNDFSVYHGSYKEARKSINRGELEGRTLRMVELRKGELILTAAEVKRLLSDSDARNSFKALLNARP